MKKTSWLGLVVCCCSFLLGGTQQVGAAPYNPPDPPPALTQPVDQAREAWEALKFDKAAALFDQALAESRQMKNRDVEALVLAMKGMMCLQRGQTTESVSLFKQSLPLSNALGDKQGQAVSLQGLGACYLLLGNPQQSLQYMQDALRLQQDLDDRQSEAGSLFMVGCAYLRLGMTKQAMSFFQQANDLGMGGDDAANTNVLGYYGQLIDKNPTLALPFFDHLIAQARERPEKEYLALEIQYKGLVYLQLKQPQQANDCFEECYKLFQERGWNWAAQYSAFNLGIAQFNLGNFPKALTYFQQSLEFARAHGDQSLEAMALYGIGMVDEDQNRFDEAQVALQSSIDIFEKIRATVGGSPEALVGITDMYSGPYYGKISLLLKQGKTEAAFDETEKIKARTLLESLFGGHMDISRYATPQEQQNELHLRLAANAANTELIQVARQATPDPQQLNALKTKLVDAEGAWQSFMTNLAAKYPELARNQGGRTFNSNEAAQILPADTALLEYVVPSGQLQDKTLRDKVVLFCLTNEDGHAQLTSHIIDQPAEELQEIVENFRQDCGVPGGAFRGKSRNLYDLLVAPAQKQLVGKKRLIVCPDRMLWNTPFQAFTDANSHYLIENYEVDYSYSATLTGATLTSTQGIKRPTPKKTLFAVANPAFGSLGEIPDVTTKTTDDAATDTPGEDGGRGARPRLPTIVATSRGVMVTSREMFTGSNNPLPPLPGTQREADSIRADFPDAIVKTGEQAQEATVKQDAGNYRYLHFATHGLFNADAPMLSCIVLAQPPAGSEEDGFLSAREIADLNLSADLVVLSACDTAQGENHGGEGLVGLTWALFAAGVPTQVVSQWTADDAGTAELMKEFYRQLKAGQPKGAALRAAELKLMETPAYSHPYFWAPFILMGDWEKVH